MTPEVVVDFFVAGTPIPQGSKRAWYSETQKRVFMTEDAGTRHSSWRHELSTYARAEVGSNEPLAGPMSVALTFLQHRPLGHYGTGKNAKELKASAPLYPTKAPDLDKLTRAVFDAMTSIVWVDDAQVVATTLRKRYVHRWEAEGVHIVIGALTPPSKER